jgi:peptidoglycan/xylan/chitin deacetylase (PgdA/CDA1 family)
VIPKRCAVSIDLDAIACYYRIHGLGAPPRELDHVIYERGLMRASRLFARRGIPVTWFVVGRDADGEATPIAAPVARAATSDHAFGLDRAARAANAERLRAAAAHGDELGNHSYSHPYELARLSAAEVDAEIAGGDRVLRTITGKPTRGFRAPGYDVSPAMLESLARRGYRYDSSIFPAPAYYAAKAAVMAALALFRRPSGAVLTNPRALVAPTDPYRPAMGAPWRRGQAPIVELPIAVTPWTRLPAIGTTLIVAPEMLRTRIIDAMASRQIFNFELHGIDFCDAEQDGIPGDLVARQADLRVPIDEKLARLESILDELERTWTFATLADIAADVQRTA